MDTRVQIDLGQRPRQLAELRHARVFFDFALLGGLVEAGCQRRSAQILAGEFADEVGERDAVARLPPNSRQLRTDAKVVDEVAVAREEVAARLSNGHLGEYVAVVGAAEVAGD